MNGIPWNELRLRFLPSRGPRAQRTVTRVPFQSRSGGHFSTSQLGRRKILNYVPSDEVLEAAVGPAAKEGGVSSFSFCTSPYVCPWSTPAKVPPLVRVKRTSVGRPGMSAHGAKRT
jgi:hypothetical protein